MQHREQRFGPTAQKVLLILAGGLALGLSGSPRRYFHILDIIKSEWNHIDQRALHYAIKNLYKSRMITACDNPDGTTTILLTEKGKAKALTYKIDEIKIPPMKIWDGRWRIIIFDIPEHMKKARDALARTLKGAGFHQLQKSVFIHPWECKNEIDFIIEFFLVRPYIRFILAEDLDNVLHLKKLFKLKS